MTWGGYKESGWCMNHLLMTNCCTFFNWMHNKCVILKLHLEQLDKASLQQNFHLQQLRMPKIKSTGKRNHISVLLSVPTRRGAEVFPLKSTLVRQQSHLCPYKIKITHVTSTKSFQICTPGCKVHSCYFPQQKGQCPEAEPFFSLHLHCWHQLGQSMWNLLLTFSFQNAA